MKNSELIDIENTVIMRTFNYSISQIQNKVKDKPQIFGTFKKFYLFFFIFSYKRTVTKLRFWWIRTN